MPYCDTVSNYLEAEARERAPGFNLPQGESPRLGLDAKGNPIPDPEMDRRARWVCWWYGVRWTLGDE